MSRITKREILFLGVLLVILYGVLAYAFYTGVATRVPGANDYYSRWMGTRLFFEQGLDPYSDEATRQIQRGMYGRLARPEEDQVAFAYPFYAAFLSLPFIALSYAWAESLWIALLVMLVCSAAVAHARQSGWPLTPLGLLALLGFTIAFYPVLRGLFLGQYTLITFAGIAFGLVLFGAGRDTAAGIAFAFAMVKPHIAAIVLTAVFAWAIWHRRWHLIASFLGCFLLVLAAATILLPSWPSEFLGALGKYTDYIQIGPPLQVWAEMLAPSELSAVFTGIGVLVLAAAFLWKWARSITGTWHAYMPTIELAMLFTTLAMLRTATTDQSMLLLLWISWLSTLFRSRPALAFASATLILLVPWLIFLATLTGNQEAPIATTSAVGLTLAGYLVFETKILRSRLLPEKPLDPASAHVAL